jgi:hypothetical protein
MDYIDYCVGTWNGVIGRACRTMQCSFVFCVMMYGALMEHFGDELMACTLPTRVVKHRFAFCARREPRLNVFKGGSVLQPRSGSVSTPRERVCTGQMSARGPAGVRQGAGHNLGPVIRTDAYARSHCSVIHVADTVVCVWVSEQCCGIYTYVPKASGPSLPSD